MLLISVLGLIVNIIGLIFFHEHAHVGHCKSHSHSHDKKNHNVVKLSQPLRDQILEKLGSTDSEKGLIKDEESSSR